MINIKNIGMKYKIAIIVIVIGLILISIYLIPTFNTAIEKQMIKSSLINKYDCAKEFDKFSIINSNNEYWRGEIISYSGNIPVNYIEASFIKDKKIFDFYDNRCFTTYKSWMQNSDFEYFIEKNIINFDRLSYQEQMINKEISCEYGKETCNAKTNAIIWLKALEKYCPDLSDKPTQEEGMDCLKKFPKDFMTNLK